LTFSYSSSFQLLDERFDPGVVVVKAPEGERLPQHKAIASAIPVTVVARSR